MNSLCPCGKAKPLDQCCGLFHSGKQYAKTPEQLMRSRYSAYALGGLGEYLLNTWHPAMVKDLKAESLSENSQMWVKLEVLSKTQKSDEGTVEFKAYFINEKGNEEILYEKSYFQRISGKWLYVGAEQ
ncbi:MAG: YchJ family protein [Gammaproteobacteria bacterium]